MSACRLTVRRRAAERAWSTWCTRSPSRLRSNSSESCKPEFDAEFVGVVQGHFGNQHLDHHIGGRASSFSTSSLISSKNRGVALMIRLLLTGSGTTTTSRSICWKGLIMPGRGLLHLAFAAEELVDRRWPRRWPARSSAGRRRSSAAGRRFSSSRSSMASMIAKSPVEPEAMMLLVRWSTENRNGASDASPSAEANCGAGDSTGLCAQQRTEHFDQRRGVAIDDAEDFDLSHGGRLFVELTNQRGDQLQALGRRRDDERVGARVGRDANVVENPRLDDPLARGVDRKQFQHRGLLARGGRALPGPEGRRWPPAKRRPSRRPACSLV